MSFYIAIHFTLVTLVSLKQIKKSHKFCYISESGTLESLEHKGDRDRV